MPPSLTESTREIHLLACLNRVAAACLSRDQRFVLLIDGIDEDCGVDDHSIAAILPAELPAGMNVIVAGRLNPPVPDDVSECHPLRDPAIVRPLAPSPVARAMRREMERDLKGLLIGPPAGQDLLGLVTAAGGGLTAPNLAEITGLQRWEVQDFLGAVAGRSFAFRSSSMLPDRPAADVLAHEQLQATAVELLGSSRLAGYRDRLKSWAGDYRTRRWPTETPEYLFRGYFRMLTAAGEVPEMVACATDVDRQDWLLAATGADAESLTEIRVVQDMVAAQAEPDLVALTKLSIHRDHLHDRNIDVPVELVLAWEMAGHHVRAEAIARTLTAIGDRAVALAKLAEESARQGQSARAVELVRDAEQMSQLVIDPYEQAAALTAVSLALVALGEVAKAEEAVSAIVEPDGRAEGQRMLIAALAAAGNLDRAEMLTCDMIFRASGEKFFHQAESWVSLIPGLAAAGDAVRLDRAIASAQDLIRHGAVGGRIEQVHVLTSLVSALAKAGVAELPEELLREAESIVDGLRDRDESRTDASHLESSRELVDAWVTLGHLDRAAQIAQQIDNPAMKAGALVALARGLATDGDVARAAEVLGQAEGAVGSAEYADDDTLVAVAAGFVGIDDTEQATRVAHTIVDTRKSITVLAAMGAC